MDSEDIEQFNKSDFTERAKDYIKDFEPQNTIKLPS
jgi:hypothetical protein